ncbi:exported protein of unknown function [Cupriavidus taiwanensis]|nr:exported protein of unknown function [Cupriavidus taiwanensis]
MSSRVSAAAATSTTTLPGPAAGSSNSWYTGAWPASETAAFMSVSFCYARPAMAWHDRAGQITMQSIARTSASLHASGPILGSAGILRPIHFLPVSR